MFYIQNNDRYAKRHIFTIKNPKFLVKSLSGAYFRSFLSYIQINYYSIYIYILTFISVSLRVARNKNVPSTHMICRL